MLSSTALMPGCGYYQYGNQPARPFIATAVTLSGWTQNAQGQWLPVNTVHVDPAKTSLSTQCSCPVKWGLLPL
jgi:hypothetical protein